MFKRVASLSFFALVLGGTIPAAVEGQAANNLSVYGYLTQGYAQTDGKPIFGLTNKGTTDYRAMALQFRYAPEADRALVVQLGHRRLAASAVQKIEPDVALDWAFFQARWAGNTIKTGRIPMPRGLFNEVRQVGALFPFFRASKAFYSEGVDVIDGASMARGIGLPGGFSLDGAVYAGGFNLKVEVVDNVGPQLITNRMRNATGAHVVLNTPVTGLRLSSDYLRSTNEKTEGKQAIATASVDLTRNRFFVRGEYEFANGDTKQGKNDTDYIASYVQGGVGITSKLWLNAQYETNTLKLYFLPLPAPLKYDNIKDAAVGVTYRFSPKVVLKGEYHDFKGYQLDVVTPPMNPKTGQSLPPGKTKYFIVSVSTAF